MVKVIVKVVVALLVLAYGAFFLSWNMTSQEIVGLYWSGVRYGQTLPVGSLVFIGLVAGAVIMAVAAWAAWASQKALADKHAATIRKAKTKLQAQLDEINDLRDQVARLQTEMESLHAGDGTWGQVTHADIEAGAEGVAPCPSPGGVAASAEASAARQAVVLQPAAQPEVDDPDVI